MKSIAKLLAFVLTIGLIGGGNTIVSAQEPSTNSSSNIQNQSSTENTDIKIYTYTLSVGDTKDVTVKSAKYYSVKGKDIISVTRSGKTLNIEAIEDGEASITLKNSKKKVIARILITVEVDELIEDTDDTDADITVSPTAQPTNAPTPTAVQKVTPTPIPVQHEEGTNRPIYNGVVYLTVGEKSSLTQMQSASSNETISLKMADGYIAAVSNLDTVSATIVNGTLYITLKKMADPYVIVADAQGKAIYRIHVMPVK